MVKLSIFSNALVSICARNNCYVLYISSITLRKPFFQAAAPPCGNSRKDGAIKACVHSVQRGLRTGAREGCTEWPILVLRPWGALATPAGGSYGARR